MTEKFPGIVRDGLTGYSGGHPAGCLALGSVPALADRLVGLVVKATASREAHPEFDFRLRLGDFSGSSHASDLNIGSPVATLPGAWSFWVRFWTGWPGVSVL